jgi:hypothetical protein
VQYRHTKLLPSFLHDHPKKIRKQKAATAKENERVVGLRLLITLSLKVKN